MLPSSPLFAANRPLHQTKAPRVGNRLAISRPDPADLFLRKTQYLVVDVSRRVTASRSAAHKGVRWVT
jgi:hypothetical protein